MSYSQRKTRHDSRCIIHMPIQETTNIDMFIRTAPHRGTCWWCSRPKIFRQNWTWTNSFESQERCAARFTAQNPKSSTRLKTTSFRNRAEGDAAHKLRCEGTSRAMTGVRTSGWSHTLDLRARHKSRRETTITADKCGCCVDSVLYTARCVANECAREELNG